MLDLSRAEVNAIHDLSSGASAWGPLSLGATPFGQYDASVGGWFGKPGRNPLLAVAEQSQQPMPICSAAEKFNWNATFSLTPLQAACHVLELRFRLANARLVSAELNGQSLLGGAAEEQMASEGTLRTSLLLSGINVLCVAIEAVASGEGCGVHFAGQVSRFSFHATSERVPPDKAETSLLFEPLAAGTVVSPSPSPYL